MAGLNDNGGLSNDSIFSAEYLGSLGYAGAGASHNNFFRSERLGPDSFGQADTLDWYRFSTVGLDEVKIDLHAFGIPQSGNFQAGLAYKIILGTEIISVVMLFDGGNQDGVLADHLSDFYGLGYNYVLYEDSFFSPEFDPHLLAKVQPGQEIFLEVSSPGIERWDASGESVEGYDTLTYIMDISPRSSAGGAVGGPAATSGNDLVSFLDLPGDYDGGAGTDSISFLGEYPPYDSLNPGQNPNWTITREGDVVVVNGYHRFSNVERLVFSDGVLAFDIEGAESIAGQAYRLYQAAFDRAPDVGGLGYWIRELDAGYGDLAWMANNFIISEEFKATYGNPETVSNESFLTLLYNNVLDRNPDTEGFAYWMAELNNGFSRERVLASFSESVENKANVEAAIQDGIWYI